jgi:long-subunit acyl-CoA synthetase (AMP-forming)
MRTQLDAVYDHEKLRSHEIWLTQPMGNGVMRDLTWQEAMGEARRMAAHLRSLVLPPGSRIAIFAKNNAWWFLSDLAIWMAGHASVPIYPTLTAATVRQTLEHSAARVVFIGKLDGFEQMAPGIPDDVRRIAMPLAPPGSASSSWNEIIAATQPLAESPRRDPDDLATIIYTSGSTGVPKGVMHSFRTMCSARAFVDLCGMTASDRALSYLPLAHAGERAGLETPNFFVGFRVWFAESLDTFLEDLKRARPTIFGSVPRLWTKFQSGVHKQIPPRRLGRLLRIPLVRRVVKKKIRASLGLDAVRVAISGSAPTPQALLSWYADLGLEIRELYGMSENFAVSHLARAGEVRHGYVGRTVPGVSHRIGENGEVLVKSPGNMLGYYEAKDLTAELIDGDGWIHTGDQGEIDDRGRLRITGRVKELFKTSKGKYVAPAPIENFLLAHPEVEQACVSGADMPQPFALVVTTGSAPSRAASLVDLKKALDELRRDVNSKLDPHERLEKVVVVSDEWTIDNGLLTPTLKLRRSAIEERYRRHVDRWYAEREAVLVEGMARASEH